MTKKQRILEFVQSKGEASYSEIILFIVKMNNPGNPNYNPAFKDVRGNYAAAFCGTLTSRPHLTTGTSRLCKKENGKYKALFNVPNNIEEYNHCRSLKRWKQKMDKSFMSE